MKFHLFSALLGLAVTPLAFAATPGDFDPAYGDTAPGYTLTPYNDSAEAQDLVLLDDGSTITSGITEIAGTQLPVLTRYKPTGALDTGFGVGGFAGPASTPVPINAYTQLARYKDQLYLLVPAGLKLYVYNYDTNGVLNVGFGVGGVAEIDTMTVNNVVDIAIQRDRIVVAGRMRNPATLEQDFVLARLRVTGVLDPSFGVGGIALHSLNAGPISREYFTGLAITPDYRIVAGGRTTKDITQLDPYDFVVARFRPDGSVDASFGTAAPGFTQIDFGYSDYGRRVALYANYQVVIAGSVCKTIDPVTGEIYCMMGTARVDSAGALDPSWNGTGTNLIDLGGDGLTVTDIALDKRERALVSYYWYRGASVSHYAGLTRYDFGGVVDPAFGPGGHGFYDFGGLPLNGYHTVKLVDSKHVATCGSAGKEIAPGIFASENVVARHYNF
jgi:uncharacterized delta-60 repeat protein